MVVNKDYQFRLHKSGINWINKVHEIPEPVKDRNAVIVDQYVIEHMKTLNRQISQNIKYDNINRDNGKINKIIYDSVLFTTEGITKHAREEIKELSNRGYKIKYINDLPRNINNENRFLLDINDNFEIDKNDYITVINQPPLRWKRSYNLKNLVAFLAFEGNLFNEWVDIINKSPIIELWTCSKYCKEKFIESGVKKPIFVIPHGINPDMWKPLDKVKKNKKFRFLCALTPHNKRKGLDITIKAFKQAFGDSDDVELLIKCNKIYNPNQDIDKLIYKYSEGHTNNISYSDDEIDEKEFVELMQKANCFVSSHRSEGFGIIIAQALACGTPVIATRATGNLDFCNEDNTLFIETDGEKWADWCYPYYETKWTEPSIASLIEQMKYVKDNYENCKKKSLLESEKIRKKWTWKNTVDKIEKRIRKVK